VTGTVYVTNNTDNTVSVLNGAACDATHHAGCRRPALSVPDHEFLIAADPATDTLYGGSLTEPQIDVISTATCHADNLSGCAPVAKIPTPDPGSNLGALDDATHTLYASDEAEAGTVMVINTATCNAQQTDGCAAAPATIAVGAFPDVPVLNPATHTVYVGYGDNANRIAVINAATCNAADTSGCGQAPGVIKVPPFTFNYSVSVKTDTLYAATTGFPAPGHTVAVINGATCNGTNHTGCGHLAATAMVGLFSQGSAVNDRTNTLYVANNFNGDAPGTLSIINTATCNGTHTAGCHRHFPAVVIGRAPVLVDMDARTGVIYATDFGSAAVSILNGAQCNATATTGCQTREQAVGSSPLGLAIGPGARTVYVTDLFHSGSVSVFRTAAP